MFAWEGQHQHANLFVNEWPELKECPPESSQYLRFERVSISSLKRGYIIPIIRLKENVPIAFDNIEGFTALYVVSIVKRTTIELVKLFQVPGTGANDELPSRGYYRTTERGTVLVGGPLLADISCFSSEIIEKLKLLRVDAISPSEDASLSNTTGTSNADALAAPFRRALHYDNSRLHKILGPQNSLNSAIFLNRIRNSLSPYLQSLPITHPDDIGHLIRFCYGTTLVLDAYNNPCCAHLCLFLPITADETFHRFESCEEILEALQNLENLWVSVSGEEGEMPIFYRVIFVHLRELLEQRDGSDAVHYMNIDFLVWQVSTVLVRWSELFHDSSNTDLTISEFKERNITALSFLPNDMRRLHLEWKGTTFPSQFISLSRQARLPIKTAMQHMEESFEKDEAHSKTRRRVEAVNSSNSSKRIRAHSSSDTSASIGLQCEESTSHRRRGQVVCVAHFLHTQDPKQFLPCREGSHCSRYHVEDGPDTQLTAEDKKQMQISVQYMRGKCQKSMIAYLDKILL